MNAYEDANRFGKEAMDNALKSFSVMTRGFQQIASETTDFTKQSYERSAQMFEKLTQARSFDRALEVQSDYAKSAYEGWIAQATKMGEIYSEIAKEAYKPLESALSNAAGRGAQFANTAADRSAEFVNKSVDAAKKAA